MITGHQQHQYSVDKNWAKLDAGRYPVNDCHEMVIDSLHRLYLLTNDTRNNILVFDLEGNVLSAWGTTYPGAHGLSLFKENGVEYLLITDHERHQVFWYSGNACQVATDGGKQYIGRKHLGF